MARKSPDDSSICVAKLWRSIWGCKELSPSCRCATRFILFCMVRGLSGLRIEILSNVMRKAQYQEQEARNLAEAAFEVFFAGRNRVAFFPGALEMLKTLSERYPVYALTNGNADASRTGISPYLKGAISSALVGASKPDPSMFHAALNQAGTSAQYCVHIGDHLHDDIRGADAVGMHSIWVNLQQSERADSDPSPTREVNQLSDIAAAVTAIEASLSA